MAAYEEREVQEKVLEIEQLKKKRKKRARRRQLVSILMLVLFGLFVFQFENITKALNVSGIFGEIFTPGPGYPIILDGEEMKNLTEYRGDPALLTNTGFTVYSPSARTVLDLQHSYTQPAVDTDYTKILLFDRQGRSFRLYDGEKLCYDKETEFQILDGTVSSDGRSAIATLTKGYAAKVTVYNLVGTEIYSWSSLDTYVIHMDFHSDSAGIAVSGVSMQNGQVGTAVTSLRFNSETASWKLHFPGEVPLFTQYAPNGQLLVLTDSALRFIASDGTISAQYDFGGSTLIGFDAEDTNKPVLLMEAFSGAATTSVVTVNANGEVEGAFYVDDTVRDMECDGNKIYILTSNGFIRCNTDGTQDVWEAGQGADGRYFTVTGGSAYVYSSNRLTKIGL